MEPHNDPGMIAFLKYTVIALTFLLPRGMMALLLHHREKLKKYWIAADLLINIVAAYMLGKYVREIWVFIFWQYR